MITLMVRLDIEHSDLTAIMADLGDIAKKYDCQLVDYNGCIYDSQIPNEVYDIEAEQYRCNDIKNNE